MAISKTTGYRRQIRTIEFSGSSGAKFEMYVKQGTNYYNWDTNSFQTTEKILKNQEIPSSGVYTKNIIIPTVTSDTSYDFYVRPLPGTTSSVSTTNEQKIGVLYQKGGKTMTFTATESSALVVQNSGSAGTDLTGGTLTDNLTTLTQTGTITETSGLFVYIHEIPSWNINDGGNWTNANIVTSKVSSFSGTKVYLGEDGGDNISSGYAVTGKGIADEITVSSISGDIVTLSAAQNLTQGQELTFSPGEWAVEYMSARFTAGASGTATVTMETTHKVKEVGITNVTSVLDVDAFASVKPNAFPVSVNCPAGGNVVINVVDECTNYLGSDFFGDIDSNQETKEYIIHSVPSDTTTSTDVYGTSSVAASASMGSTGVGVVTYTAAAGMQAGDTDYFYYKTTDAQSTPVASATDQGKISITIV
jgi:hypothetical protein